MARKRTRTVEHRFFIQARPAEVYRAFTDPKQIVRWLSVKADVTPRKGEPYSLEFDGGWQHQGTILEVRPGRSITFSWAWKGVPVSGTRLRLSASRKGKGTLFTIEHLGFPTEEKWVGLYGVSEWGWTYYSMNLKSVLESGHDLRASLDG